MPTLLLVVGLLAGLIGAGLARAAARVGARRRRTQVGKRLRGAITDVADDQLVEPVRAVLERHRDTRKQLEAARGD